MGLLLGSVDEVVALLGHFVGISRAAHGGDDCCLDSVEEIGVDGVQCLAWLGKKREGEEGAAGWE